MPLSTLRIHDHDVTLDMFTCKQEPNLRLMIQPQAPLGPPIVSTHNGSMGLFRRLPHEVRNMVFEHLQFQQLTRLAQTSHGIRYLVQDGFPLYNTLRTYAPELHEALGRTGLVKYYEPWNVQEVFFSSDEKCQSCRVGFGAFYHLLLSRRYCFECLHEDISLRVVTTTSASDCFQLYKGAIERKLPVLRSIPGTYGIMTRRNDPVPHRLVSIQQVANYATTSSGLDRAVAVCWWPLQFELDVRPSPGDNGRALARLERRRQTVRMFLQLLNATIDTRNAQALARHLRLAAPLPWTPMRPRPPLQTDYTRDPTRVPDITTDAYAGMVTMRVPVLRRVSNPDPRKGYDIQVIRGRACIGCAYIRKLHGMDKLPLVERRKIVPQRNEWDVENLLRAHATRLYNEEDFATHIQTCYGVVELLNKWEREARGAMMYAALNAV
ncbi:hypothetical protein SBRCBS47491_006982 [Sporothrix bragantina]|uniref:F-box domain-containing protein n=1 Tax=Sporothrix bragantina TaxID=671064 RepID=A0ABP0CBN8_9PEZI